MNSLNVAYSSIRGILGIIAKYRNLEPLDLIYSIIKAIGYLPRSFCNNNVELPLVNKVEIVGLAMREDLKTAIKILQNISDVDPNLLSQVKYIDSLLDWLFSINMIFCQINSIVLKSRLWAYQ